MKPRVVQFGWDLSITAAAYVQVVSPVVKAPLAFVVKRVGSGLSAGALQSAGSEAIEVYGPAAPAGAIDEGRMQARAREPAARRLAAVRRSARRGADPLPLVRLTGEGVPLLCMVLR